MPMTASFLRFAPLALLLSAVGCATPGAAPKTVASETVDQAFDRLAIRDLLERFSDAVNHGEFEIIPTLFAADAVWETKIPTDAALGLGEGFHFRGPDGIRSGLAKSREQAEPLLYTVLPGPIELHGNGRASSRSTMHELLHVKTNDTVLDLVGTYSDTFVEQDGVWRFASRSFRLRYAGDSVLPRYRTPR
jgi:hypothetical protein